MTKEQLKTIQTGVDELIQQALVLLAEIPEAEMDNNWEYRQIKAVRLNEAEHSDLLAMKDEDGYSKYFEGDIHPDCQDELDLSTTKSVLKKLANGSSEKLFTQYYNSNC